MREASHRRFFLLLFSIASIFRSLNATAATAASSAELLTKENIVDAAPINAAWNSAEVGQKLDVGDRLRTGALSRATVRLTDLSVLRLNELTTIRILSPERIGNAKAGLDIQAGATYFFSREKPEDLEITTPVVTGALRGTEFHVSVGAGGFTTVIMLDGQVELTNAYGGVLISSGEEGQVAPGHAPTKTAVIEAINIIEWCLYYPGVLDLTDLSLSPSEKRHLADSLSAYAEGDLLGALELCPAASSNSSDAERIYRAAVLLAVGQVDKAKLALSGVSATSAGRRSIEELIAAVKYRQYSAAAPPETATQWLAHSYYTQSRSDLQGAFDAAQEAVKIDPAFGYGWVRLAELQFSFGRTRPALHALERGLQLSPRNAQAFALRGFLLSAQNNTGRAKEAFGRAIALDGALGNAWLGRGLCYIREGRDAEGRADIQTAALLEPNRSIFRSYLGKAFSNVGSDMKARQELERATHLDPNDPTPWLYSALQAKQEHKLNEAVRDLEQSIQLNGNRRLYRSEFLLDQDRAVRSTNLASIYQDDGMTDVSVREATRAVEFDYANASAHRFLADSYNALRDPRRITLRYETPWKNELLLSNLLSPVGGGSLSAYVSEQEYSKLFEADRVGVTSVTDYYSTGELRNISSQYGISGNISYAIDSEYLFQRSLRRPNSQTSNLEFTARFKIQLFPDDTVYGEVSGLDLREGDVRQLYDPAGGIPGLHFHERQEPGVALAGYHHEWNPGIHTLLLVGRLADSLELHNPLAQEILVGRDLTGDVAAVGAENLDLRYQTSFEIYTGELNQIIQTSYNTLVLGVRLQRGTFDTTALIQSLPSNAFLFDNPAAAQSFVTDFGRTTVYVYDTYEPFRTLSLTLGASYDALFFPENYRQPPIASAESSVSRLSPKAGVTWNPVHNLILRGAYARALGGVSFDESILLEPTQISGFNQVFRTIIPEALVGSVAAPKFENAGLSVEEKFESGTYIGLQGTVLHSSVQRTRGDFETTIIPPAQILFTFQPNSLSEHLSYTERNLIVTVNQLIGDSLSFGGRYQLSDSTLRQLRRLPRGADPTGDNRREGTLHRLDLFTLFNHPSGLFARCDAIWYNQTNSGYGDPGLAGDQFWQFNIYGGYRFHRNRAEIMLGFLNITDQNYRLNPLNLHEELPRERTLFARLRLDF